MLSIFTIKESSKKVIILGRLFYVERLKFFHWGYASTGFSLLKYFIDDEKVSKVSV